MYERDIREMLVVDSVILGVSFSVVFFLVIVSFWKEKKK